MKEHKNTKQEIFWVLQDWLFVKLRIEMLGGGREKSKNDFAYSAAEFNLQLFCYVDCRVKGNRAPKHNRSPMFW